jgi:hypothetical protein
LGVTDGDLMVRSGVPFASAANDGHDCVALSSFRSNQPVIALQGEVVVIPCNWRSGLSGARGINSKLIR